MTHDMSRSRMSHNTSVGDLFKILVLHFINKNLLPSLGRSSICVGGSKLQLTFNCKLENGTIVEMRQEIYNLCFTCKFSSGS